MTTPEFVQSYHFSYDQAGQGTPLNGICTASTGTLQPSGVRTLGFKCSLSASKQDHELLSTTEQRPKLSCSGSDMRWVCRRNPTRYGQRSTKDKRYQKIAQNRIDKTTSVLRLETTTVVPRLAKCQSRSPGYVSTSPTVGANHWPDHQKLRTESVLRTPLMCCRSKL
jgi:hypothetical protein